MCHWNMVQSYKKYLRLMRFSMIIFLADATCRILHLEVAQRGASDTLVSDGNIPNENKHPKRFKSMENAAKTYSEVNISKIPTVSFLIFLLPCSLHVTSHRRISLLTEKSSDLSGHWRLWRRRHCRGNSNEGDATMLVRIRTWFRTSSVVKVLNQEFGFLIFLCLRMLYLLCRPIERQYCV